METTFARQGLAREIVAQERAQDRAQERDAAPSGRLDDRQGPSHLDPSVYKNVDVANALKVVRPTLGDNAGIALYRLLRLVALEDIIGRGAAGTAYLAGKKLGQSLGLAKVEDFLDLCKALKIGIIEVPVMTDKLIHVDVYECVTCSGLDRVGRPLCHFEGGMVAGVVEGIVKRRTRAQEVTCIGGLGDKSCGFDLEFR